MSSKLWVVCLGAALLGSVGCSGVFVAKEKYDQDVNQLKAYVEALERDNAALRPEADAFKRHRAECDLASGAQKTYAELADALKRALAGLDVEPGAVTVDEKTGAVRLATEFLFDLGSWVVKPQAREVLQKFAQTQRGALLKIVGHTDRKPIVREATKKGLETDTNMELSAKRAVAVMGELLKAGLSDRQIASVEGHGAEINRRCVEIYVVGEAAAPARAGGAVKTSAKPVKK
jgi:flagellar motor protein MotB